MHFRFVKKELEIQGEIFAETSISRMIDLLSIPCERKKWDLRLIEMKLIPETNCYVFTYNSDRTLYEFHTVILTNQSENIGVVEFKTICYEFKQKNTILGNFTSVYQIGLIEDQSSSTKESDEKDILSPGDEKKTNGRIKLS